MTDYAELRPFATPRQIEYLDAIEKHGSVRSASEATGISRGTIRDGIASMQRKARSEAVEPKEHRPGFRVTEVSTSYDGDDNVTATHIREGRDGPFEDGGIGESPARDGHDGYLVKGVSTLFDSTGQQRQQWVKTAVEQQELARRLRAVVDAMAAGIVPLEPVLPPAGVLSKLLTLYTFTDYHVGMLAWNKEGGDDWDLAIAQSIGTAAMQALVAQAPSSHTGVVSIQGDWMHWDGLMPVTPTHGHVLDADGRFGKVVDVAIDLIMKLVNLALQKHAIVRLVISEGNHDLASSLWLRKLFARLYAADPRVQVLDSELPYYAMEWGKTMLGWHHGHLRKNDSLPALFAAQFREMWGRCPKVYLHVGHRHHKEEKDHPGCRVTQHATLAARDAHAARGGWWSEREINATTYHQDFGVVGTTTVTPEMLQ